jgi:hypothetical protein
MWYEDKREMFLPAVGYECLQVSCCSHGDGAERVKLILLRYLDLI